MQKYELFEKIDNTAAYSLAYRQKLKDAYLWFEAEGFRFSEHGLNRVVSPKRGRNIRAFTFEDVLEVLKSPVNYAEGDKKHIRFYNGFAGIEDKNTGLIISFIDRGPHAKSEWRAV